jgi:hypothetical protein
MATTTNFGWETPDDTDLVKDGAAAMRTLGNSIDTSFVDLKGGTSGQILSKASNTDLDYTWITNDQGDITAVTAGTGITVTNGTGPIPSVAIDSTVATLTGTQTLTNKTLTSPVLTTPSISNIDAKGDLLAGTADNTIGRLAVGANGTVLTADSAEATGMKWVAAAGGGGKVLQMVYATYSTLVSNSTSTYADTGLTATITPTSATSTLLIFVNHSNVYKESGNATSQLLLKLLRGSTQIYEMSNLYTGVSNNLQGSVTIVHRDSPATTSSLTYKTQFRNSPNAAAVTVQADSNPSSMTILEIGA